MKTIAIVGLGIVGGSFAKAIHTNYPNKYQVMGIDTNEDTLHKALELGVISKGETSNQTILQQADLVIIALYPTFLKEYLIEHRNDFKANAIVTETSGIKETIIEDVLPIISDNIDFIFGHPMAGRESKGFDYSDGSRFDNANYIITPHPSNKLENLDSFAEFLKGLKFSRITIVSPEVHDEMIAYTSQLCHIIASALINSDTFQKNAVEFVGDSFRELTRIAKMNENLWTELMLNNRHTLLKVMSAFEDQFAQLKEAIAENDAEKLEQDFIKSTQRRIQLEQADLEQ